MGRAFSEHEKEQIRARLIEISKEEFEKTPFQLVKVEFIAKQVGISKGAFYNFYPSKESLFLDVLIAVEAEIQRDILSRLTSHRLLREQLIDILYSTMILFEKSHIFKSFSDRQIQTSLLEKASQAQKSQMLLADQQMLSMLLRDDSDLKVSRDVALDMMRSVFFIAPYKDQLESNFEVFMKHYITSIIEGIIKEDATAFRPEEGV
ncbi:TetR/AcrR family transcriptional regulator [Fusibacter bizertensis]|uniref:TetR/AcrR family transcriptional regulator n=1 Tax=Fusibacter bizertensis TaxID=1488331 RepID=A0ABT6NBP5_9FIRM|nr:TetR/AcrR family transcriptional regulator [Fusibacter bizertensis]MDH8677848.1 TetR/AcrR family transcriptional regulator [Fusibacter bizertensis]